MKEKIVFTIQDIVGFYHEFRWNKESKVLYNYTYTDLISDFFMGLAFKIFSPLDETALDRRRHMKKSINK